jgi:hypothetical protein
LRLRQKAAPGEKLFQMPMPVKHQNQLRQPET